MYCTHCLVAEDKNRCCSHLDCAGVTIGRHNHCRQACRQALHLLRACPPIADSFCNAILVFLTVPVPCPPITQGGSTACAILRLSGKPSDRRQNVDGGEISTSRMYIIGPAQYRFIDCYLWALLSVKIYLRQLRSCTQGRVNPNDAWSEDISHYIQSNLASKVLDGVSTGDAPCSRVTSLVSILQRRNPAGCEMIWYQYSSWARVGPKSVMQV